MYILVWFYQTNHIVYIHDIILWQIRLQRLYLFMSIKYISMYVPCMCVLICCSYIIRLWSLVSWRLGHFGKKYIFVPVKLSFHWENSRLVYLFKNTRPAMSLCFSRYYHGDKPFWRHGGVIEHAFITLRNSCNFIRKKNNEQNAVTLVFYIIIHYKTCEFKCI